MEDIIEKGLEPSVEGGVLFRTEEILPMPMFKQINREETVVPVIPHGPNGIMEKPESS
jgi:hypothetical protein